MRPGHRRHERVRAVSDALATLLSFLSIDRTGGTSPVRRQDILRTARRTAPTPRELHTVGERAPSSARSRTLTPNWRSLSPTSLAATNLGRVAAQRDLRASHRPRSTLPQRKTSESARSQAARYRSRPIPRAAPAAQASASAGDGRVIVFLGRRRLVAFAGVVFGSASRGATMRVWRRCVSRLFSSTGTGR